VVALRLAAEVCRGIHAAHELTDLDGTNLGVVHRDLSPGNMILTFDGHVKILDFGIAFMHGRESPDTQVGELKGKPSYMAPEQLRAERVDRRSDLYSLSVVLHEMMTGRKLFTKNNVVATVLAVERGDVPKPSDLNRELPTAVDGVIMKGLSKDAAHRYQSAKEMATVLDGLVAELGSEPTLETFVDQTLVEEQRAHKTWLSAVLSGDFEEAGTYERFVANPDLLSLPPEKRERSLTKNEKIHEEVRPLVGSTTLVPPPPSTADVTAVHQQRERRRKAVVTAVMVGFALSIGGLAYYQSNLEPIAPEPDRTPVAAQPADEVPPPVVPVVPDPIEAALAGATGVEVVAVGPPPEPQPEIRERKRPDKKKSKRKRHDVAEKDALDAREHGGSAAFGFLTIGATPYALVRIDGKEIGVTPIMKRKLPTGRHSIQLVRPDTGEVRLEKVVSLDEGQHERITLQ
jgi:serine/threonine-protein kinase